MFGGNFAPRGWAYCDGQLLPISQYSALFSLLGTIYGGDGRTTFALPDLRGRFPLHPGNGPGLPSYRLGERGGTPQVNILAANLPSHNHGVKMRAARAQATVQNPNGNVLGGALSYEASPGSGSLVDMSADSIQEFNVGNNIPLQIENPFLGVNFIIALQGTFPSRS